MFVAAVAMAIPFAAEANAGTPLMWGAMLHLVLGNLFIGICEGSLLLLFEPKRKWWTCVLLMVCANYASAWLGFMAVDWLRPMFYSAGIEHLKMAFWCAMGLAWLFTIIVEAPFVWLAFRGGANSVRRAAIASVIVQSISYVVLFAGYSAISVASLFSVEVVDDFSSMRIPEEVRVKFLGEDGEGYVMDLQSRDTNKTDASDMMVLSTNRSFYVQVKTVGEPVSGWKTKVGFWAAQGMRCHNEITGRNFHLAFETPFQMWAVRNATQLPDGKVIFQLDSEICIADPEKNQVAPIVRGRYPIVEMGKAAQPARGADGDEAPKDQGAAK